MSIRTSSSWSLAAWVPAFVEGYGPIGASDDARMEFVLALGTAHVAHGSGGPFAAAVFADEGDELLAVGVNMVVPTSVPLLHAEMVAFALAGPRVGSFDLGARGPITLVTSTEPCAMCIGAVVWSGVRRVVYGASDADARAVGFDEGDKSADWPEALRARGIEVTAGVLAEAARALLTSYSGPVYNGGGTT